MNLPGVNDHHASLSFQFHLARKVIQDLSTWQNSTHSQDLLSHYFTYENSLSSFQAKFVALPNIILYAFTEIALTVLSLIFHIPISLTKLKSSQGWFLHPSGDYKCLAWYPVQASLTEACKINEGMHEFY